MENFYFEFHKIIRVLFLMFLNVLTYSWKVLKGAERELQKQVIHNRLDEEKSSYKKKSFSEKTFPEEEKKNYDAYIRPLSVNYHFLRTCNYSCGFCFHTAKTSFVLPLDKAKYGLQLLVDNGMEKINFSGGEPFLYQGGKFLGELIRYCKDELKMRSVSVVTNGSKVTEQWMIKYGCYLDIMAVSCDSFNDDVNKKIGRYAKNGRNQFDVLHQVRDWCREYNVMFKLNTVVNRFNVNEDMCEQVKKINPIRWKVFQCLAIEAENIGGTALRQVEPFLITDEEFNSFLIRHKELEILVPENNIAMRNSYLILDEYMRFLDNTNGFKTPSKSLLDVGVQNALNKSGFDETMFFKRGGKYQWSKIDQILEW